jgi:hypothetical protein
MSSKSEIRKEMKAEGRELKQMFSSGKAQISGQNTRTAVLKATSTDPGPPKKKHVQCMRR